MTQILRHLGIISLVPEAVKKKSFSMLFRLNNFNWFIQVLEFQLLYVLILKLSFESYLFFWFPCQHFLFPFKSAVPCSVEYFIILVLKSLSENSNIYITLALASAHCLFSYELRFPCSSYTEGECRMKSPLEIAAS